MAKNTTFIFSIVIFTCLFFLIQTDEGDDDSINWIYYYKDEGFELTQNNFSKVERFAVEFHERGKNKTTFDGPFYMKIEVTVDEGPAPLLCFSHGDSYCEEREILVKNPNGKSVFFWVKKEQFQDSDCEPYFVVTCPGNKNAYTYTIKGEDTQMPYAYIYPQLVYSYLVTSKNKKMEFSLTNLTDFSDGAKIALCLDGSSKAKLNYNYLEPTKVGNLQCVSFYPSPDELDSSRFSINGNEKEYLTLSVHSLKIEEDNSAIAPENFLVPNGPPISGYITGGITKECFPVTKQTWSKYSSLLYIEATIHTKYAKFFFENSERIPVEEKGIDHEYIDGKIVRTLKNPNDLFYFCLEVPKNKDYAQNDLIYTIQIMDYEKLDKTYRYSDPMMSGVVYRRIVPKNSITYYYAEELDKSFKKYDYTLSNIKGFAKVYITDCWEFPNCPMEKSDLASMNETIISPVNNHWIWTRKELPEGKTSSIDSEQKLMVVYCEDINLNQDYCIFETSVMTKGQDINLIEDNKLYKFILKNEKGNLIADLKENRHVTRLTFDIMIFSGDVTFEVKEKNLQVQKIYLSNKILFNIVNSGNVLEKVTIEYTANLNSFFNIKYSVDGKNQDQLDEFVTSGENYLVQINPLSSTKGKIIHLNHFFGNQTNFMANFFSLNCDFEVKRDKTIIAFSDGYAQDNIPKGQLHGENYDYDIKITDQDKSRYTNKMCMLYVEGLEIPDDNNFVREIIVAENINQQIIFEVENKFTKVRFTYPVADVSKDLTYHINVIDKAHYKINGYLNGQLVPHISDLNISSTSTYFLFKDEFLDYCEADELCMFRLEVEMVEKIVPTNPMIEVTFREIKNIPTYLQKGRAKLDYVCGDKKYFLYTDLGRNDVGEISLNFLREFGSVWVRVVKKDLKTPEPDADWRGMFRMPDPEWEDSLPSNNYTKKIKITTKETENCINGCYLLITVKINEIGDYVPDSVFYSFNILVKITANAKVYTDMPKMVIQVDEYIVGALDIAEMDDKFIYDFYEIWLPHDSDTVEFDWQSSLAGLYINVGGNRPTTQSFDFIMFPPGRHALLYLYKDAILEVAKEKKMVDEDETSLQDINLVIGVWTNKTDSVDHELYSLRVHQNINDEEIDLGILESQTDQKMLCLPKEFKEGYDSKYRCLFMIDYLSDPSIFSPIYVYGYSSNPMASVSLYGSFIDRDKYHIYNIKELKQLIPFKQTAEYNPYNEGVNYIYISELPPNKYLFINLVSDMMDDLMLINSVPIFDLMGEGYIRIYPNSHTEQLFSCKKDKIQISFWGDQGIAASFEVIAGEAEIGWENDTIIHKVKGAEDRLILFSDKKQKHLEIRNTKLFADKLSGKIDDPGFLFFITYKARAKGVNFDEIQFQKTAELGYENTDLPAILYCKLGNVYKDLNIAIQFMDNSAQVGGDYSVSPINIISTIMKEDTVYSARMNGQVDMDPKRYDSGYYDPSIKTALIYLSKDQIDSYNIRRDYNPTLYISVKKSDIYEESTFENFNIEAQVAGINDDVIPVEKIYHYGKLGEDQPNVFYRLKVQKKKTFMRVQVAFNSPDLEFTIHSLKNNFDFNETFSSWRASRERGKVIVTFEQPSKDEIYLNIFRKSTATPNAKLSNYAFKYITADYETDFYDYKMMSPSLTYNMNKDSQGNIISVDCTFNQIHADLGDANVTYFLKIVENSTYIYGEEMSTIAGTESPSFIHYERNPTPNVKEDYDKITLKADGYFSNWGYINVIAQIQQNNIIEYVAYNGVMDLKPVPTDNKDTDDNSTKEEEEEKTDNTVLFGVIGGILGAIAIALIIVIVIFQIRNKNLMNQVKHVSFQKTNTGADPNLLLQKPADNIN